MRSDIVWTDDSPLPVRLIPPFDVTPDRPVIGWLPPAADDTCCWIEVSADVPAGDGARGVGDDRRPAGAREPSRRGSNRPYRVWASSIEHVRVEGTGTIKEVSWLPSNVIGGDVDQADGAARRPTAPPLRRPRQRGAARRRPGHQGRPAAAGAVRLDSPPAAPATLPIPAEVARVARLAERARARRAPSRRRGGPRPVAAVDRQRRRQRARHRDRHEHAQLSRRRPQRHDRPRPRPLARLPRQRRPDPRRRRHRRPRRHRRVRPELGASSPAAACCCRSLPTPWSPTSPPCGSAIPTSTPSATSTAPSMARSSTSA